MAFAGSENGQPHMTTGLACLLVTQAFQRGDEGGSAQIPRELHA